MSQKQVAAAEAIFLDAANVFCFCFLARVILVQLIIQLHTCFFLCCSTFAFAASTRARADNLRSFPSVDRSSAKVDQFG